MKILKLFYFAISIMIVCVSCIRQRDVEVTQTLCVANQTNDTWLVHEVVSWGGTWYVDSASLQVGPMQSDSVSHYFKFRKGGAKSLYLWYTQMGCWIETKLVNQNTQECYKWKEILEPQTYKPLRWPHFWNYVGEEREIRNTDYHTFKCVINQELLDSLPDYSDNIDKE